MLQSMDFTPGNGVDLAAVTRVLLLALVVQVISGTCWILQGRLTAKIIQQLAFRLRREVQAKLSRLPLSYFDRQPRGDVLSRTTNDIDNLVQNLQQTMSQLINSLLLVIGVLAMMFWISPVLALVGLVTVPASVVITGVLGRRAQRRFAEQWRATGQLSSHVEEMYTGHALVKMFHRQAQAAATFRDHNEEAYRSGFRAQLLSGIILPVMTFMGNLSYIIVAVAGGFLVLSGAITIGDVQAFIQYSHRLSGPLTQVTSLANLVQSGIASAERVFALLDAPEQSPESPFRQPREVRGRLAFEAVSFRYAPERPLIEGLSLSVQAGQLVALVGPTGAGKTTLASLLMRFYELDRGRITLDGVDIASMSREQLRSMVGMVLQDSWLFGGTIAENIAYGKAGATREQVRQAAVAAHADHFIRTLPDGYDTVLGDDESALSTGEEQLVTIARAFLSDPVILLLDEATSSVDTRTELLVQRAMRRLTQGRTSFVIAHRLTTIRDADLILVMEDGAIVEWGTHRQLLQAQGAYARLHAAQFLQASSPTLAPGPGAGQPAGLRRAE
jgi:ATP-binding cassette subfamily B protein